MTDPVPAELRTMVARSHYYGGPAEAVLAWLNDPANDSASARLLAQRLARAARHSERGAA